MLPLENPLFPAANRTSAALKLSVALWLLFLANAFALTNPNFQATPFSSGWTVTGSPSAVAGIAPSSTQGVRLSATGQALAQNVSWGADWWVESYFAIRSTSNRAFSHIIALGGQTTGINLRYEAGAFAVYNGTTAAWVSLPTLGTLLASTDANNDGDIVDAGDTKNVYRIRITGRSFGTAGWNYDISLSEPNSTEFTRSVAGLTTWQTASGSNSFPTLISFSSVNGNSPGFWFDDVKSHEDLMALPVVSFLTSSGNIGGTGLPANAQLSWVVTGASTVSISGIGTVAATGTTTVAPATQTTYTLTATNAEGQSTTANIVIAINSATLHPSITEFQAADGLLRDEDGDRPDWIELFNPNTFTLNVAGYTLTDTFAVGDEWTFPLSNIPPGGYLVVFASGKNRAVPHKNLHTSFSLAASGEYLALSAPGGALVQRFPSNYPTSLLYPKHYARTSYGIFGGQERYFKPPTPGAPNGTGFDGVVEDTNFSIKRGIYTTAQTVAITTLTPGAEIRYTTSSAEPTATTGTVYTGPLTISSTTTLRAAAFKAGFAPTNVDTNTYIFPADVVTQPTMSTTITQNATYGPQMIAALTDLPSISLVTPNTILNGTETVCSFEYIPTTGTGSQENAGVELFGGAFTNFAKKSFRFRFKADYGAKSIKIPDVFTNYARGWKPRDTFDELELRSGSHDMKLRGFSMSNMFSDAVMFEMGQFSTHGRFVHMYYNGSYHGVFHLRERWGGDHHNAYFGGSDASVESINGNYNVGGWADPGDPYDGDGTAWTRIKSLRSNYAAVKPYLNVNSYVDFMVMWMFGNSENEWRSTGPNNVGSGQKYWLNDADGYLAVSPWDGNSNNTTRTPAPNTGRLDGDGPGGILSALHYSGDSDFQILVADRIHRALFGNGPLTPAANAARLTAMCAEVERAFYADAARWSTVNTSHYRTPAEWLAYRDQTLNSFFPNRTSTVISQLQTAGYYPTQVAPAFIGSAVSAGTVINFPVSGATVYFTTDGSDPRLPGGNINPAATVANSTTITQNTWLRARSRTGTTWSALNEAFYTVTPLAPGDVLFSEINYNAQGDDDSEFIELWNPKTYPINMRGAKFTAGISYDFPDNRDVVIPAGGRLVLCGSMYAFQKRYGIDVPVAGVYFDNLGNDGDTVTLSLGVTPLFSINYQDAAPWPDSADGDGYSLVLANPAAPTLASSWRTSTAINGNPGTGDTAFPFTGNAFADADGDGIPAIMEHFFSSSDSVRNNSLVTPGRTADGRMQLTFTRRLAADDLLLQVQVSSDLVNWTANTIRTSHINNGNNTATETWAATTVASPQFMRLRVVKP